MVLRLPIELRLRIAKFALEQRATAGIAYVDQLLQEHETDYRPSENLTLLLVCRQFYSDFARLAYNKTRFLLWNDAYCARLQQLPSYRLRDIRKLACHLGGFDVHSWGSYFLNLEHIRLDELVFLCPHNWANHHSNIRNAIVFLRRLVHVSTVKFVIYGKGEGLNRAPCYSLIGAIMKEDHFQRYDAPGAPNVGATAWDWHLNSHENSITLQAKDPEPVTAEEEFMRRMKPKVDALITIVQQEAGL